MEIPRAAPSDISVYAYTRAVTFTVSIAGASGYAGGELLRLVSAHPELRLGPLAAGNRAGHPVTATHPQLVSLAGQSFVPTDADTLPRPTWSSWPCRTGSRPPWSRPSRGTCRSWTSAPTSGWPTAGPGTATTAAPTRAPGRTACPSCPGTRRLAGATRVANPGCYPTAVALALAPLLAAGLVEPADVVVVAASGTSGAGRKATESLLASEVMGSMWPYKVGGVHQHTPEMEQALPGGGGAGHGALHADAGPDAARHPRHLHRAHQPGRRRGDAARRPARRVRRRAVRARAARGSVPCTAATVGSNSVHLQVAPDPHSGRTR